MVENIAIIIFFLTFGEEKISYFASVKLQQFIPSHKIFTQ